MIAIIDYGMGNVGSIVNMIKKAGGESKLVNNPEDLRDFDAIILPGVGSFDIGMDRLEKLGFIDPIRNLVLNKKVPILGICLGMQLMTLSSEEGVKKGLGLIEAETVRFKLSDGFKVPHMGWNYVTCKKKSQLTLNFKDNFKYYFVHSYFVKCKNDNDVLLTTLYQSEFCSAYQNQNITGVQFHPEKSHNFGLGLFKNFLEML